MKNRTLIRASAKSAAEVYAGRRVSDVLVLSFMEGLDKGLSLPTRYEWHAVVYSGECRVVDTHGFDNESDAVTFSTDLRKFLGLSPVSRELCRPFSASVEVAK